MSAPTLVPLWGRNVAHIERFGTRVRFTIMAPSEWEEHMGYSPAESVSMTLSHEHVAALVAALQASIAPTAVGAAA